MLSSASYCLRHCQRRPLAASAIALFAVSTTSAWAAPPAVTNCNDDGSVGSLRYAVDPAHGAVSGDTIDMSGLTTSDPGCSTSTITLTTGAIAITLQDLTLIGPGKNALLIKQTSPNSRVIVHNVAASQLSVSNLSVGYASVSAPANSNIHGGCIASLQGSLTLHHVGVYHCTVTTDAPASSNYNALGGGVFAAAGLTITDSVFLHDVVSATNANVRAQGGCATTDGPFDMDKTLMAYCYANGPIGGGRVRGGALELKGSSVTITGSVIGKSQSTFVVGGIDINNATGTATISNSTIAYNYAHYVFGGLYANSGQVNLNNSTIVLNTARQDSYTFNTHTYNAGVGVSIYSASGALSLQSTIIANNSATVPLENLDLAFGASTGLTFAASNNLVRAYKSDVTLPTGHGNLLQGTCPLLGHIRNNGGNTYTFAPQSGSPVIDVGNNTANDPHTGVPAIYDQRGGPPPPPIAQPPDGYPRVSAPNADIGAHEVQKSDIVFYTEFETGCP